MGIYGFGAAAHIITQVARHEGREVFAFTRPGDLRSQQFARSLGAARAGDADGAPPAPIDAALIFAPAGALVPLALGYVKKSGDVICAGIHMSDIPSFPYALLWRERRLCSVANLTRADGEAFFRFASIHRIDARAVPFALERANEALDGLRSSAPMARPYWCRRASSLCLRRNRYFQDTIALIGKEIIGFLNVSELKAMGDQRFKIDTARGNDIHQAAHAFLAAGAQRRHNFIIPKAGRKSIQRQRQLA